MMGGGAMMGGGWGLLGALPMLLWWGLIIAGVVALMLWVTRRGPGGPEPREDRALDVLRERYARGEIGKEEFDVRKRDLA